MKSLTLLWQSIARECAMRCHTSTDRDFKTVTSRVEGEGISFLTITLPAFGKEFERALDQGFVGSNQFAGFRHSGGLPLFLRGFLHQIFDAKSGGRLLPYPSVEAIHAVRQLTLMFGKVLLPCSPERERKAVEGYVQCEIDVGEVSRSIEAWEVHQRSPYAINGEPIHRPSEAPSTGLRNSGGRRGHQDTQDHAGLRDINGDRLRRLFLMLFGDCFAKMEQEIWTGNLDDFLPRHGPGSTADGLVGNQKYTSAAWPARLEPYFPALGFLRPSWRWYRDDAGRSLQWIEPGQERPVKVILVPKSLKTPRVIAMEPTVMQYAQQAVLRRFLKGWERDENLSSFLGFDDQVPNQNLALIGSRDGSLATLDLSEASDRVSNQLVEFLFARTPLVAGLFQAVRTRTADVDGFGVIPLSKYASMGSALCFPVMAIVLLTVILYGMEECLDRPLSRADIKRLRGKVRVFGDDIIVPVDYVSNVVSTLEAVGFKVNESKSFWTGKFRESCGKEYYDGHDVSIVRFRRVFPTRRSHAREVISLVEFRNQLYEQGFWSTCQRLDETITKVLGYFPIVESTSPILGRRSVLPYQAEQVDADLHTPLVRGYTVRPRMPKNKIDGISALTKWFIAGPQRDPLHLVRGGRPQSVDIKLRWATPY